MNKKPFDRVMSDVMKPEALAASLDHMSYQYTILCLKSGETDPNLIQHLETLRLMRNAALESGTGVLKPMDI